VFVTLGVSLLGAACQMNPQNTGAWMGRLVFAAAEKDPRNKGLVRRQRSGWRLNKASFLEDQLWVPQT
jgi:hypothetical protein